MLQKRVLEKMIFAMPPMGTALTLPTAAQASTVDFGWAVDLAVPYLETGAIALAAALVGWLASRLGRWVGLEIERDHAEALHGAIARGVRHAVSLVANEVKAHSSIDIESRLIAETAIYLERLMPDALRYFSVSDDGLDRLIRAHLGPDLLHWTQTLTPPASPAP